MGNRSSFMLKAAKINKAGPNDLFSVKSNKLNTGSRNCVRELLSESEVSAPFMN